MRLTSRISVVLCCLWSAACGQAPPNILLVTFDTTRWDHVGYASGRAGLTPTLDALAARGTWFETATVSAPVTLPSHATILTGLEPYRHGVRNNGTYHLPDHATTLAECLADHGYRTHAVVSAFVLDSRFGLDQGFLLYDDDLTEASRTSLFMSPEIPAERTAAKAIEWLNETGGDSGPFFLWLHFFDPHASYDPPSEFVAAFPGEPYAGEIAYADAMLGRVVAELERQNALDDTLVVFLSDHGESLGQHGERTHGIFIYDATVRVPMFLAGPGVAPNNQVGLPVRSVDVMPTILDLVGAPIPPNLDGISLRPLITGDTSTTPPAYLESMMPRLNYGWSELRGIRTQDHKVILAPRTEVYDLNQDPGELKNLFTPNGTRPAKTQSILDGLTQLASSDPITVGDHLEATIEDETQAALDALGYTRSEHVPDTGASTDPKDRITEFEALRSARALIEDEAYIEAKEALTELIALSPSNMDAILSIAHVHQTLDETPEAIQAYDRALEINPHHGQAIISLARLLTETGHLDRSEELLVRSRPTNTGLLELHIELGRLFEVTGRIDDAQASFEEAIAIDPNSAQAAVGLAGCHAARGNIDTAIGILERAYDNNRNDPDLIEQLALLEGSRGSLEISIALHRKLVDIEPENPSAWNNLASQFAQSGQYSHAAEAAQRAYELDPGTLEIRANLGTMLVLAGRLEEGVAHLDIVVPRMPDNTYAAGLRAQALEYLGRNDQALVAWKELALRDPAAAIPAARLELGRHNEEAARNLLIVAIERGGDPIRALVHGDPVLQRLISKTP